MMLSSRPQILQKSSAIFQKGLDRLSSSYAWSNYPPVDLFHQEVTPPSSSSEKSPLPPIVICHGLLGNSGNWVGLARVMAEETGRRVLLPDLRNHGRSPHSEHMTYRHLASDLRRFLSKHDLSEVTMMGHSMGARTAMLLCLTDPERIGEGFSIDATPIHATPQHGVQVLQNYFR